MAAKKDENAISNSYIHVFASSPGIEDAAGFESRNIDKETLPGLVCVSTAGLFFSFISSFCSVLNAIIRPTRDGKKPFALTRFLSPCPYLPVRGYGLGFVTIDSVRCDLVIPTDILDHPAVSVILDVLQTRAFRDELSVLPGYETTCTGEVVAEI